MQCNVNNKESVGLRSRLELVTDKFSEIIEADQVGSEESLSRQFGESQYKELLSLIAQLEKVALDGRYNTLHHKHPLRFQVNLSTGVANGVLVARSSDLCVELIERILSNRLEFEIEEKTLPRGPMDRGDEREYLLLEKLTKSAFRVVTGNERLTNTFWNLYMQ